MYTRSQTEAASRANTSRSGTSRADTSRAGTSIRTGTTATNRSGSDTTARQHRRHHRARKFPPEQYTDLTRNDLALLASILTSQPPTSNPSAHGKKIQTAIASLPSHLHCKHPLLSPFCALHSKLAPLPTTSLFHALRAEIEDEIPRVWAPLAEKKKLSAQKEEMVEIVTHLSVLWLGPKVFTERFHRVPRRAFLHGKPSKCSACLLVSVGGDFPTLVAMAGLFIGRVRKGVWGSSKRIQFLLEWTVSRLPASRRQDGSELVWDIGRKFRVTRLGALAGSTGQRGGGTRKRARGGFDGDGEVEDESEGEFGPGTASYAFSLDRELREERSRGPRKLIGSSAFASASSPDGQVEDFEQLWVDRLAQRYQATWDAEDGEEERRLQGRQSRPRSSMYSCDTNGEPDRPPSISIDEELDGLISLYQDGAAEDEGAGSDSRQHGYPQLNPYADDEDSDSTLGYKPTTMSRIQSTIDRAFGKKWDGTGI